MKKNTAYLYINNKDYYAIYVNLSEFDQMIFFWSEKNQCQRKKPIWRVSKDIIEQCSIELFTRQNIKLSIFGEIAEFNWDQNYYPKTRHDPVIMKGSLHDPRNFWNPITPPYQANSPTSTGQYLGEYSGHYSEPQPFEDE